MNSKSKRILAFMLTFLLLFVQFVGGLGPVVQAEQVTAAQQVQEQLADTKEYFLSLPAPRDDWDAFAFYLAKKSVHSSYVENIVNKIEGNSGNYSKATDLARLIVALNAAGQNPEDINGINLVEKLYSKEKSQVSAENDAAWALLALDSKNYEIPEGAKINREFLLNHLVEKSLPNGGWGQAIVDPDITGMVMSTLGPYKGDAEVDTVLNKAAERLKTVHPINSNSIAQMILGLTAAGVNPAAADYVHNGENLMEQLLSFASSHEHKGQFGWTKSDAEPNDLATQQSFFALEAYHRLTETGTGIIFRDINGTVQQPGASEVVSVRIVPLNKIVTKGETVQLAAEATDAQGTIVDDASFTWKSSNPEIAEVTNVGHLTAKEAGTVNVTVQSSNDETIQHSIEVTIHQTAPAMVTVTVEGPQSHIASGQVQSINALQALEQLLTEKDIQYEITDSSFGKYVSSIKGISGGTYGGYDGWSYLVKRGAEWISPNVGMADFELKSSDEVIVYYGDGTAVVKSAVVSPAEPKAGEAFTVTVEQLKWVWNEDWTTSEQITPAAGATVKIGNQTAQTNADGKAVFQAGLAQGEHEVEMTKYEDDKAPSLLRETLLLKVAAAPAVTVTVEGPQSHIASGQAQSINALQALEQLLTEKDIQYEITDSSFGKYVSSIKGISGGTYGGYDGWSYLVKRGAEWISPNVGMADFELKSSDEVIVYYGDGTAVVKSAVVSPAEPKAGEAFTVTVEQLKWVWNEDWTTSEQITPAAGATVTIGSQTAQTNAEGKAAFTAGLPAGDYKIEITGYGENKAPKIVRATHPLSIAVKSDSGSGTNPAKKTAKISVIGDSQRGTILSSKSIDIETGNTVYDVLIKAMGSSKVEASGSGSSKYIIGIDGLNEFDRGPKSGWMFSVNGEYVEKSSSSVKVSDGDVIVWKYTLDLGEDIGGGSGGGSSSKPPTDVPKEIPAKVAEALAKAEKTAGVNKPVTKETSVTTVLNAGQTMGAAAAQTLKETLVKNVVNTSQKVTGGSDTTINDSKQETQLIVPKGALKENKTIAVKELEAASAGEVISSVYEFSPSGTTFEKPVYLSLKLAMDTTQPEQLVLAWLDEKKNEWIALPTVVDAKTGIVTGAVQHFTKFAVIDKSQVASSVDIKLVETTIEKTVQHILTSGEISDWEAFALASAETAVPSGYIQKSEKLVKEKNGIFRKITDYERLALAVKAAGYDPQSFAGYNLIEKIYNAPSLTAQGTNGLIFALLAIDSGNYAVPANAKWSKEAILTMILASQYENGGFPLTDKEEANIDITAMALSALAPYEETPEVNKAIEKGVKWLSSQQNSSGGFSLFGDENSGSLSQAIIALTALGMDPKGEMFTKPQGDLITSLLQFQTGKGGFTHLPSGEEDEMATEQALMAFVAYERFLKNEPALYHLKGAVSLYKDDASIASWTKESVYQAKEYTLMEGAAGYFHPKNTLTRAQFTKMLVRMIGEQPNDKAKAVFSDVKADSWFYGYVETAKEKGLIQGYPNGEFKPYAPITRQQIAVMIARAFQLKGSSTALSYTDVDTTDREALLAIQAMQETGIMIGSNGKFRPYEHVSREMAAVIAVRLYEMMNKK
jgi:hypothetical protein